MTDDQMFKEALGGAWIVDRATAHVEDYHRHRYSMTARIDIPVRLAPDEAYEARKEERRRVLQAEADMLCQLLSPLIKTSEDGESAEQHVADYYRHRYSHPDHVEVRRMQFTEEELVKLRNPGPDFINFYRTG